jgi:hypothetical protein
LVSVFVKSFKVIKYLLISITQTLAAHFLLLLLKPHEELLSVAPDLGTSTSANVLLDHAPILAVQLQSFKESLVLSFGPTTMLRHFVNSSEPIL